MMAVWLFKLANKAKLMAMLDQYLPSDDAFVLRNGWL